MEFSQFPMSVNNLSGVIFVRGPESLLSMIRDLADQYQDEPSAPPDPVDSQQVLSVNVIHGRQLAVGDSSVIETRDLLGRRRASTNAREGIGSMRLLGTCLLLLVLLTGCKEVLYDNLNQREANKLVTTLRQSDIEAERVDEGDGMFSVLVERNRFAEAVTLLEQRGLPRERFDTMADVFTSDSLLSTPLEERARLAYALSQELMRSLTAVDGILDAHVHLTLSRELPLSNEATPATASVLLNHAPGFDIEALIPDVKFLVAQGVPNLSYRDVFGGDRARADCGRCRRFRRRRIAAFSAFASSMRTRTSSLS